ncbi:MAG TPA: hypothetical protein VFJ97_11210 [Dermatophilaceae bacterium]|nr:hypothetical protein [Dermatophilaceae bacterium]
MQSSANAGSGRLQCPFCNAYDVTRLYVASLGLDSCRCAACGAGWDEDRTSGRYRGGSDRASILVRRS